jgi:hypothetical protein
VNARLLTRCSWGRAVQHRMAPARGSWPVPTDGECEFHQIRVDSEIQKFRLTIMPVCRVHVSVATCTKSPCRVLPKPPRGWARRAKPCGRVESAGYHVHLFCCSAVWLLIVGMPYAGGSRCCPAHDPRQRHEKSSLPKTHRGVSPS